MSETTPTRPNPDIRNAGADFWRAAARGTLLVPLCGDCNQSFWHPRPRCPYCGSGNVTWKSSAGKGTIHTYTVVRQSADPYFSARVPYVVAMVNLDEGPIIMTNIIECPIGEVAIGKRVGVVFDSMGPDIAAPVFRLEGFSR